MLNRNSLDNQLRISQNEREWKKELAKEKGKTTTW
jgi:hypothetical protein